MKRISFLVLTLALTGCFTEPTYDPSSAQTMTDSLTRMQAELSEAEASRLRNVFFSIAAGGDPATAVLLRQRHVSLPPSLEAAAERNLLALDGMNAQQIFSHHSVLMKEKQADKLAELKHRTEQSLLQRVRERIINLAEEKKFDDALVKLEKFSSGLSSSQVRSEARELLDKIVRQKLKHQEFLDYIEKIEVTEFATTRRDNHSGPSLPAVRLGLKNNGDRFISRLVVKVYFAGESDPKLYKREFVVISNTASDKAIYPAVLEPGGAQRMPEESYLSVAMDLAQWQTGEASMEISEIRF